MSTLIDKLDHVYRGIVYTVYLIDVLVESHTAQLLLDYHCTRIEVSVVRGRGGGGGGGQQMYKYFFYYKFIFSKKNSWGPETQNDTLLPLIMIYDRRKFQNDPPWRSKVIVQKPWRRKKTKNSQNHKAFPVGNA